MLWELNQSLMMRKPFISVEVLPVPSHAVESPRCCHYVTEICATVICSTLDHAIRYQRFSNLARSNEGRCSFRSLSLTAAKRLASGSPDLRETAAVDAEVMGDSDGDAEVNAEADAAPPFA